MGSVSGQGGLGRILSSRPYVWLRPDFIPPLSFLVVKDAQTGLSRILVEPHLINAEFRKAWMLFFCRSGHPVVTPDQFPNFVGHLLLQEPFLDLPRITGRDLQDPRLRPGSLLHWILRMFFLGQVVISCMLWLLMSFKSVDTVVRSILDCALGRLGLPDWFRKVYFSFHSQVRLRFKLAAGLGELWCRDGGFPQGCPLSIVFIEALHVPWCRHLGCFA